MIQLDKQISVCRAFKPRMIISVIFFCAMFFTSCDMGKYYFKKRIKSGTAANNKELNREGFQPESLAEKPASY